MMIGVICPADIAFRRFMPSLFEKKCFEFEGVGVASAFENGGEVRCGQLEKAERLQKDFGGKIYHSYEDLVRSKNIDAVYLPLPPALHYKWAKMALECKKHVLLEKPSTLSAHDTSELIEIAKKNNLALHENYMFAFHKQLSDINNIVASGEIGDVRLYRISFGFPLRAMNDFRYNKSLGGGALMDAGGYTLRYASMLLGDTTKILCAQSNYIEGFDVDMYGSASLVNDDVVTAQVAFGMDNNYKCELEVWGSRGTLFTGRVLTAPDCLVPEATIKKGNEVEVVKLSSDCAFSNSIKYFKSCIDDNSIREQSFRNIQRQSELVDCFKALAKTR